MSVEFYGIPGCDTVKKARKWCDANGVAYNFHDYKKVGADPAKIAQWIDAKGVDLVLNRRGTTYRKLSDADKASLEGDGSAGAAVTLLQEHTSMIKRPIVEYDGGILVGFKEDEWVAVLT